MATHCKCGNPLDINGAYCSECRKKINKKNRQKYKKLGITYYVKKTDKIFESKEDFIIWYNSSKPDKTRRNMIIPVRR